MMSGLGRPVRSKVPSTFTVRMVSQSRVVMASSVPRRRGRRDLFSSPFQNSGVAADLPADVVNDGVWREGGLKGGGVTSVDGLEIVGDGGC